MSDLERACGMPDLALGCAILVISGLAFLLGFAAGMSLLWVIG